MTARRISTTLFLLCLAAYTIVYLRGVAAVPFHPDESSYLFMSTELEALITDRPSLYYSETPQHWGRQMLRLLDPPMIHYLAEVGRRAAGQAPLPVNWSWGDTWEVNRRLGALPTPQLLQAGRMAVAVLFPISLALFFFAARRAVWQITPADPPNAHAKSTADFTAWVAVLLIAGNALLLLHTRRVMAEGILIFTLALFFWTLVYTTGPSPIARYPWITALPAALAFCAKPSLAPLALVGLVAVLWQPKTVARPARLAQSALYAALFAAIVFAQYPIAWYRPVEVARQVMLQRAHLAQHQQEKYAAQAITSPGQGLAALVRQTYFAAPAFYEDPSYTAYTAESEAAYLARPQHNLLRSPLGGGLLLILTLLGLGLGIWDVARRPPPERGLQTHRTLALLLLATLLQAVALLAAIPLEWQRYYLPLLPWLCFWIAYAVNRLRLTLAARLAA